MAPTIKLFQYLHLRVYAKPTDTASVSIHRLQNYFVNQTKTFSMTLAEGTVEAAKPYDFAPFSIQGTTMSLGGDNNAMQLLLPMNELAIKFVEVGNGNRNSRLSVANIFINAADAENVQSIDHYVGQGASFSEDTIELRFRGANDSVGNGFPSRKLTRALVGVLPLNADVRLQ